MDIKDFIEYQNQPTCGSCKFRYDCDLPLFVTRCSYHNIRGIHLSNNDKIMLWDEVRKELIKSVYKEDQL